MKRWIVAALLLATACSKGPDHVDEDRREEAGLGVDVTAAPGVAFRYDYSFRLPAGHIAGAQEAHAQACERLGVTRCRITGMTYNVGDDRDVDGSLSFALEPSIARAFGREGIAVIEKSDGMLSSAEISGTDTTPASAAAAAAQQAAKADGSAAQGDLAAAGSASERAELLRQRAEAKARERAAAASIAEQRTLLASTPMMFRYVSGTALRSFGEAPLARAADNALASTRWVLTAILWVIATLGPPLVVLTLLWLAWRRVGQSWWRRLTDASSPPPPSA
ncbi:hypothetical protein [Sphingomonas ginsenosidimutans]|jgi:hypothetical protein|uniref:DUF4349 domain-containing protein n=1 Tax=Sphingomonas ginsenosidimutans TaxID=862134 RepID=A0A2A4HVS9_9SPHN|nr:hypothetical protein [Sphingomonas ginsenosidimutans]MEE2916257.1 hypothetical protein [Pseudomonadota bacterium]PCG07785.1 hypothetical protein COA17_16535 [Sphingomonas ginsenosidimutans]